MSENFASLNQYISQMMLEQSTEPSEPSQDDVLYFEQQMGTDFYSTHDNPMAGKETFSLTEQTPTINSSLMAGIEQARNRMKEFSGTLVSEIQKMGDSANMVDALKLQYKIMAHGVYVAASTKLAEKTSKGIQTLFKPQ